MTQDNTFKRLSEGKISTLFWQYALPAVVGMVVNTMYNIIDGVFIGHWVGTDALAALGVVLPVMNICTGVGMLIGIGSAARMSISLGLKEHEVAEKIAGTSLIFALLLNSLVLLILFIFLKPILMFVGASPVTYPYARDFLVIYLPGSMFLTLCFNFNAMMRASGYPLKAMITMLVTVVANIILAPIFILVLHMGMKGAAIATTISMFIGFVFVMYHFFQKNSTVRLKFSNVKLDKEIIKSIVSIGLSPFFMQMAASVVVIFINFQLHRYAAASGVSGDMAIAAFSNANRLIMFIIMVVIGITQGMQPIIGYNYGAKHFQRVKETLFYAIKIATCVTTLGFLLGMFLPEFFVRAFSSDPKLIAVSADALRGFLLMFVIVGSQVVISSFFMCIGMARKSIFLGLSRQILFLIPALFVMPLFFGLNGIWLAGPVADTLAEILAVYLLIRQIRAFNGKITRQGQEEANVTL